MRDLAAVRERSRSLTSEMQTRSALEGVQQRPRHALANSMGEGAPPSRCRCAQSTAGCAGAKIGVLAKIESADSVGHLEEILDAVDGAMVARGDLGAELPVEEASPAWPPPCAVCQEAASNPMLAPRA